MKKVNYEDYECIIDSKMFDEEWYLKKYSDVAQSGLDPVYHYLVEGVHKGYNPNSTFDTEYYLETHSDVKNAGVNPLIHYIKYGKNENRSISPEFNLLFSNNQVELILKNINKKISIIIPIYNAFDETKECIESIIKNTFGNYELILINDCSSDSRMSNLLNSFSRYGNIKIIENDVNKGFTGTVNVGLLNSSNNDVVLLNSDTKVTKNWLNKLIIAAYSDESIGTVTPVSNNSGAFSVPIREISNDIPDNLGIAGMANLVEKVSNNIYMEVPTANGFCMYIKRETINDVGLFDEINFEKGYGEENDYSMRALKKGWKHIIDDSTYIYHKSGASFSEKKIKLMQEHRKILDIKFPDYTEKIQSFINSDELKFIEDNVKKGMDSCFDKNLNKKRILYVMHNGGGGTKQVLDDLTKHANSDFDVYFLTSSSKVLILYHYNNNVFNEIDRWYLQHSCTVHDRFISEFRDVYFNILVKYSIDILHIHHLLKHSWDIAFVSKLLNIPVILSVHDFYFICPCYTLLNENMEFCAGKCNNSSENCRILMPEFIKIDNTKAYVNEWRRDVESLFETVDYFITTHDTIKDLFLDIYPNLSDDDFKIIEHGEDFPVISGDYHTVPDVNEPTKILFLGNINFHKGSEIIRKLNSFDIGNKLELHFLGTITSDLKGIGIYHGSYKVSDLPNHLKNIKPSFIGIFSIVHETFCYTLSESWYYKIPVLSFDVGVVGERMRKNNGGWFVDEDNVENMFNKIMEIIHNPNYYNSIQNKLININLKTTAEMFKHYLEIYNDSLKIIFKKTFLKNYLEFYNCLLTEKDMPPFKNDFILEPKINSMCDVDFNLEKTIISNLGEKNQNIVDGVKKIVELNLFDFSWYLSEYGDVKNSGMNPLVHYIKYGADEFRNPSMMFNTKYYLEVNKDVKKNGMNPLIHYALYGINEGREYAPIFNLEKNFQVDFSNFLSRSVLNPLLKAPFSDIDKKYFEIMGDVATKLMSNVKNNSVIPLVSIIMPSYNRADIIMEAINSVINQSYTNWELIIIDDGSSDNTVSLIKNIDNKKIKLIESKINNGASSARNSGLNNAKGELIAYLDTDNDWDSHYLEAMVGAFLELPDADAIYSGQYVYENDFHSPVAMRFASFNKSMLKNCNYIDINCFMHKKEVYDEIGGFDEKLKRWVDWDYIIRISDNYSIYSIPIILSNYHQFKAKNRITDTIDLAPVGNQIKSNMSLIKNDVDLLFENKVSIILQNFSSSADILECVNKINKLNLVNVKIIVVVSSSIANELMTKSTDFNLENLIYVESNNNSNISLRFKKAISVIDSDSDIMLLDVKSSLDVSCFNELSHYANALDSCGIVIPQQILHQNNSFIVKLMDYSNKSYDCDISLSKFNSKIINVPMFNNGEIFELSSTSSICMYIKQTVWSKLNLFDFDSDDYYEWRIRLSTYINNVLNLNIYYVVNAEVYYEI